ncbi:L-threonylcarbamoyladenylate synthase [Miniphocaeibacter halophilus]|uniref:Threonylcarbamoyl-AMP synthase n=1 Tax=Miniphocaeibacter halophilus TaxID=2931922 RepID=A0AC61MY72_9FIRM|nr:L-threonylcarbamoyladenylate synthase [Miniphocaeibacter halophilus]QQK07418.1 threonylcarbamoyl-AMP synthase [Miniphocaeibacter halophilus]
MQTEILKIDDIKSDYEYIKKAADIIRKNELVAIPTETVYGLGANGLSKEACKKIFEVKGRPQDNPLILHISEIEEIKNLILELPVDVKTLLENLWPGPLTVIFNKSDIVPSVVTAGGNTVAIRMPSHNIAREIIKKSGVPIAAPSANISGRPSPTTANDVYEDLKGKIPLIIDGGQSSIGIESTVLDVTEKPYTILRPGFYDKEDLEEYLNKVVYDNALISDNIIPKSPGQKYKHYAPKANMEVIIGDNNSIKEYIRNYSKDTNKKTAYILFEENKNILQKDDIFLSLGSKNKLNEMAHNLFRNLRLADKLKVDYIICEGIEEKGIGIGIMNRLKKSSSHNIRRV